jgi:hypothetical protein|tara:strand:- start:1147 stop:1323 length:177 start_codon:yes stop_codon:yes gene_type:complete
MYSCPNCNKELLWGGDHSYEDYGIEPEDIESDDGGIVTNLTCHNEDCDVETVIVYSKN